MTTSLEREVRIRSWMLTTFRSDGIERFNDLHIDGIDPKWKARQHWLKAGLKALHIAMDLRDGQKLPVDISLAFSLKAGTDPVGINFKDAATFQEEFDWSPPSLYLMMKGEKPWSFGAPIDSASRLDITTKSIDLHIFGEIGFPAAGYFIEFKQANTIEHSRTVHLIG